MVQQHTNPRIKARLKMDLAFSAEMEGCFNNRLYRLVSLCVGLKKIFFQKTFAIVHVMCKSPSLKNNYLDMHFLLVLSKCFPFQNVSKVLCFFFVFSKETSFGCRLQTYDLNIRHFKLLRKIYPLKGTNIAFDALSSNSAMHDLHLGIVFFFRTCLEYEYML